jgi:ribosomal protein S18 acetylase RimI-like enzyme
VFDDGERADPANDVSALIEANIATFLLQMGRAGGGHERSNSEVTWTAGGSPIGYHNAIVRFDSTPERAPTLVSDFHNELRTRGLPGSCHLTPTMRPSNLAALLIDLGFEDGGDEPAMAADLTTIADVSPTELAITRVTTRDQLNAHRDVLAAGFGEGPKEADWVQGVFTHIGYDADWSHFVGRVEGKAVATASMLLTPPAVGIYFVCTTPAHRRKGYGAAITQAAMLDAAQRGASHAVLGSSPMGQGIYEALGFKTVFAYRLLEWEP